jgi:hypothetical protein
MFFYPSQKMAVKPMGTKLGLQWETSEIEHSALFGES